MMHSMTKPSTKRRNRISKGENALSNTFVEMNVVPHTITVKRAAACPAALVLLDSIQLRPSCVKCQSSLSYHRTEYLSTGHLRKNCLVDPLRYGKTQLFYRLVNIRRRHIQGTELRLQEFPYKLVLFL